MKAFKVVQEFDERLMSANSPNSVYAVEYKEGEYVEPKLNSSYLFCFKTLADAQQFMKLNKLAFQLWECEIEKTTSKGVFVRTCDIAYAWRKIFDMMRKKKKICTDEISYDKEATENYRSGTIWAKRVKLTKRIE